MFEDYKDRRMTKEEYDHLLRVTTEWFSLPKKIRQLGMQIMIDKGYAEWTDHFELIPKKK